MKIVKDEEENVMPDSRKPAAYDPNKKYTWQPDTVFTITGSDYGVVLNAMRVILSSKEAQKILLIDKAHKIIEKSLADSVSKGNSIEKV